MNQISTQELMRLTRVMRQARLMIRRESLRRRLYGFRAWNMGMLLSLLRRCKAKLKAECLRIRAQLRVAE